MELLYELFLTVSLSLIFTSLFIKLSSMSPVNITDNIDDDHQFFTDEAVKMDKFQCVPLKEEVIKLQECPDEGKSMVEFHKVTGVEMEDRVKEVLVVDCSKEVDGKMTLEEEDEEESRDHEDTSFGCEEEIKMCEIEIESEEEGKDGDDEEEEMMDDDWEKIGRRDFEELLVDNNINAGVYKSDHVLIPDKLVQN